MSSRRSRPGDPKVAVAYCRASTSEQHLSPEAQRAAIEAWASREGIRVAAWHMDQGVSGGSELDERPGLIAALGELRVHRAGILVIAKRDRLARDVAVAATIEKAARANGSRVVCADGVGNGDTPADSFMRSILDAAAQYERALIRARTRAALQAKRARGERAGEVPYGYSADSAGRLQPHEAEIIVIARVRELRAAGMSFRAIVCECRHAGGVSRAGHPLGKTQIERIVKRAA